MDSLAIWINVLAVTITFCGLAYLLLSLWSARDFSRKARTQGEVSGFAPEVSILKPIKGVDPAMYAGFVSHCRQEYVGKFEILFGVGSLEDPAVQEVQRLQAEFPDCAIRLFECTERLGLNGKVSTLARLLREAAYDHIIINDSDILVGPRYLERVMAPMERDDVGLVTVPYRGHTARQGATLWAKLEALGISTDFFPSVLTARKLEGGIKFGLGSTLATTRQSIQRIGGLEPLAEYLGDDYELGVRLSRAGLRVELIDEPVETSVQQYDLRGFIEHQLRWVRCMRDARRAGYVGVMVTYALAWALLTCIASGAALWSFTLLSLVMLARVALALTVGVGILRDEQVLRDLWLLPLRDCVGLMLWAWSYAGDTVVWRGERFKLDRGKLSRAS